MTDAVARKSGISFGLHVDPNGPEFQAAVRRAVNARAQAEGRGPQTHGYETAGVVQHGDYLERLVGPDGVASNGQFADPNRIFPGDIYFMAGTSPVSARTEQLIDDAVEYERGANPNPAEGAARWQAVREAIAGEIRPLLPTPTATATNTSDPGNGLQLTSEAQAKVEGLSMWALGTDRLAVETRGALTQLDTEFRMSLRDQHLDQTISAVEGNLKDIQVHNEDESWLREGWDWLTGGGAGEEFEGHLQGKVDDLKALDARDEGLTDAEYDRELQNIMGNYGKDFKKLSDDLKESGETWNTIEEVGRVVTAAVAGIVVTAATGNPALGFGAGLATYEVIDGAGDVKDLIEGDDVYADGHSSISAGVVDLLGFDGSPGMSQDHLKSWAKDNTIDALSSVTIAGSTAAGIKVSNAVSNRLAFNTFGTRVVSTTAGGMTAQGINGVGQLASDATALQFDNKLFTADGGKAMLESAKAQGIHFALAAPTSAIAGAIPIYRVAGATGKPPLNWAGISGQFANDMGSNVAGAYLLDGDISKDDAIASVIGGVPGTLQNIFVRPSITRGSSNELVVRGTLGRDVDGPSITREGSDELAAGGTLAGDVHGPSITRGGSNELAAGGGTPVRYVTHIDADGNPSLGLLGPDGKTIADVNAPWNGGHPSEVVVLETSTAPDGRITNDAVHRLVANTDGTYSGTRFDADGNVATYTTGGAGSNHPLEGIQLLKMPTTSSDGQTDVPAVYHAGGKPPVEDGPNGPMVPGDPNRPALPPAPNGPAPEPLALPATPSGPVNMRYSHRLNSGAWVMIDTNRAWGDRIVYHSGDEGESAPPSQPVAAVHRDGFVGHDKPEKGPPTPAVFNGFAATKEGEVVPRLAAIDTIPPQDEVVILESGTGESTRTINKVYEHVPVFYYDNGTWLPLENRDPPVILKRQDPSDPYDADIPFLAGRPTRRDGTSINDGKFGPLSPRSFKYGWKAAGDEFKRRYGPGIEKLRQLPQRRRPAIEQGSILDGIVVDRPMLDQMSGRVTPSSPDTTRFSPRGTLVDNVFGMPIEGVPVGTHVVLRDQNGNDVRAIVIPKDPPKRDDRRGYTVTTDEGQARTLGLIRSGYVPEGATETGLRVSDTDVKGQDRGNTRGRGVDGLKSQKGQVTERSALIALLFSRTDIRPAVELTPELKADVGELIKLGLNSGDPEFRQRALNASIALSGLNRQANRGGPAKLDYHDRNSLDRLVSAAERHPEAEVIRETVRIRLHGRAAAKEWDPLMLKMVGGELTWVEDASYDVHVVSTARNTRSHLGYVRLPEVGSQVTPVQRLAVDDLVQAVAGSPFTGRKPRGELSPNGKTLLLAMAAQNPKLRNLSIDELVRRLDLREDSPNRLTGSDFADLGTRAAVGDLGRYVGDGGMLYLEEGQLSTDPTISRLADDALAFFGDQPKFLQNDDPAFRADRQRAADLMLNVLRADKNSDWVSGTELHMHPSYKGSGKQSPEGQDVSDLSMALLASAGMWDGVRGYVSTLATSPSSRDLPQEVIDRAGSLLAKMPPERPVPGTKEYGSIMQDFLNLFDSVKFDPRLFQLSSDIHLPRGENLERDWNNLKFVVNLFRRTLPDEAVNAKANSLIEKMDSLPETAEQYRDLGVDFVSLLVADNNSPYRTVMVVEDMLARMRDMQRAYRTDRMTPTQYAQEHWTSTSAKEGVPWLTTLGVALGLPISSFVSPIPTAQGYIEIGVRQNGPEGTNFLLKVPADDAEGLKQYPQGWRPSATWDHATGEWILNADAIVKVTHQTEVAFGMGIMQPIAPGVPVGPFANAVWVIRTIRYIGSYGGRPGYNLLPKGTRLNDEEFRFLLGAMGGTPYKPEGARWGDVYNGEQMLLRNFLTMPINKRNDTEWLLQQGIFRHLQTEAALGPRRQGNRYDKGGGGILGITVLLSPQVGTVEGGPVLKVYEQIPGSIKLHPLSSPQAQAAAQALADAGGRWIDPKTGRWIPEVRQALMAWRGHINGGSIDSRTNNWVPTPENGQAQPWHRETGGLTQGVVRGAGDDPVTIDAKTGERIKGPAEEDRRDVRASYKEFAKLAFQALPNLDTDIPIPQAGLRELMRTVDDPSLRAQQDELGKRISGEPTLADFDILNRLLKLDVEWEGLQR